PLVQRPVDLHAAKNLQFVRPPRPRLVNGLHVVPRLLGEELVKIALPPNLARRRRTKQMIRNADAFDRESAQLQMRFTHFVDRVGAVGKRRVVVQIEYALAHGPSWRMRTCPWPFVANLRFKRTPNIINRAATGAETHSRSAR